LLLDNFELLFRIAKHKNTAVFLGVDKRSGQPVVVKGGRVPFHGPSQTLLEKELLSAPLANCPGVPQLLDVVAHGSWLLWVEQPYGTPLDEYVRDFPPNETKLHEWAKQMVDTLKGVHSRSVIHRDIKPSNITISPVDGRLCLIDFGVARKIAAEPSLDCDYGFAGTEAWASPEAFAKDLPGTFEHDWESLCYTFYSLEIGIGTYLCSTVQESCTTLREESSVVSFIYNCWKN